jgi:hypothetical protein
MQREFSQFSKSDYARYPFLKAASKHVRLPELKVEDLSDPQYEKFLKRAEERLQDAILYRRVFHDQPLDEETEIMSFPVAIMLTIATGDSFVKKRYALAEANQVYEDLMEESKERILGFARNFGWGLLSNKPTPSMPYEFSMSFIDSGFPPTRE